MFAVMEVDALLVPSVVVADEVFAELATPLLWRFLQEVPVTSCNCWAADMLDWMASPTAVRKLLWLLW